MKVTSLFGPKSLKYLNILSGLLFLAYLASMFVFPVVKYWFDLATILNVWDRWQSLNVGLLAYFSSVIVLNISRYNTERERERNFIASRAFLPSALSELSGYCDKSMVLFQGVWEHIETIPQRSEPFTSLPPDLPGTYRQIFKECIGLANTEVGEHLAYILKILQVHHSRMTGLVEDLRPESHTVVVRQNIISYLYGTAEIKSCINSIFEFARGTAEFKNDPLTLSDLVTALRTGNVDPEDFGDLVDFMQRALDRRKSSDV